MNESEEGMNEIEAKKLITENNYLKDLNKHLTEENILLQEKIVALSQNALK